MAAKPTLYAQTRSRREHVARSPAQRVAAALVLSVGHPENSPTPSCKLYRTGASRRVLGLIGSRVFQTRAQSHYTNQQCAHFTPVRALRPGSCHLGAQPLLLACSSSQFPDMHVLARRPTPNSRTLHPLRVLRPRSCQLGALLVLEPLDGRCFDATTTEPAADLGTLAIVLLARGRNTTVAGDGFGGGLLGRHM